MEDLTDEELMQRVVEGEIAVMRYLFDRYHVRIYNFALQLTRDEEASKDITQDVFYKMIKHKHTFKRTTFSSWIYTIARNRCYDHFQIAKKRAQDLHDFQWVAENGDGELPKRNGCTKQLNQALDRLSLSDRELIVMSRFQGLKYREIAEITNSNEGALKTKMHRALRKLKAFYFANTQQHEL
ncbi:MAG: RNA polymerase sigma factor [Bacteroidota bacterium]